MKKWHAPRVAHLLIAAVVLWGGQQIDGAWTWRRLATFGSVVLDQAGAPQTHTPALLCETLKHAARREILAFDETRFLCLNEGVMPPLMGQSTGGSSPWVPY